MSSVVQQINDLKPEIIKKVTTRLTKYMETVGELQSYEIVWKELQDLAVEEVGNMLYNKFPNSRITIPRSKSTYPDIKLEIGGKKYAIDVKCAEIQKDPWYDMARIDTYIKARYNIYAGEWELLIQYDSEQKKFLKVFFGLFREFVGYRADCKGVKYRPYDGKIRPKTWDEFENNIIYWDTDEKFLQGLKNSQIHRWKSNISKHLIPILTEEQKQEFKDLFDGIISFEDEE